MARGPDLAGQPFGRLTVLARSNKKHRGRAWWKCQCKCGRTCVVPTLRLRNGDTTSCGCVRSENAYTQLAAMKQPPVIRCR